MLQNHCASQCRRAQTPNLLQNQVKIYSRKGRKKIAKGHVNHPIKSIVHFLTINLKTWIHKQQASKWRQLRLSIISQGRRETHQDLVILMNLLTAKESYLKCQNNPYIYRYVTWSNSC